MHYDDFILTLETASGKLYSIKAKQRYWVGNNFHEEQTSDSHATFDADKFLPTLSKFTAAVNAAVNRQPYDEQLIRRFAIDLSRELFKGSIKADLLNAQERAGVAYRGLRIWLELPPELQVLPWECMRQAEREPYDFLCLNAAISIIRSGPGLQSTPVNIQFPLRVLVVVCTPFDYAPLNARAEIKGLLSSLSGLIRAGKVQADFVHGADTLGRLQQVRQQEGSHTLHFIAHSEEAFGAVNLILEDAQRRGLKVNVNQLWGELQAFYPRPHLATLNVCKGAKAHAMSDFNSIADGFLNAGIPGVIAHSFEISDRAAEALGEYLYERLASGDPVDEALATARRRLNIELQPSIEWLSPVLFHSHAIGEQFYAQSTDKTEAAPDLARLIEKARKAESAKRLSEAADYAQETLLIEPSQAEMRTLLEKSLAEEALDTCIHKARFAERCQDWVEAVNLYGKYLSHPAVEKRPEREREQISQFRFVAQAGMGTRDPWLKWRG